MHSALSSKSDHSLPLELFRDLLREYFSESEVERQIETALNWGRYGDLFTYDSDSDRLLLYVPEGLGEQRWRRSGAMMPRIRERRSGPPWVPFSNAIPSLLKDIPVIIAGLALLYGLMSLTRYWAGPVNTQPVIHLHASALPKYALFSVARLAVA
jgi:hypothetical protein